MDASPAEPGGRRTRRRGGQPARRPPSPSPFVQEVILAHLHDAVFATDPENRVTFWAPSAERLFGYSAEEAVGRPFGELLPYRMATPSDEASFLATLREGRTWRGSGTVRLRDGSEIWVESAVQPIVEGGQLIGSVSVSRDITAAVEAQRTLVEQERFVNAIIDVAEALVTVLDASGRIIRFNRACERLSGYTYAEVVGHPLWDRLIPESEAAAARATLADLLAGNFPKRFENHWQTRSGELRRLAWSITCLVDADGAVTHVIGTGLDVTDMRRTSDALRGIEAVGRLLTTAGPTDEVLGAVLRQLSGQMGYAFLTLVLREGDHWRLGAQLGYPTLQPYFDPAVGVIGRVIRTGEPAFVTDVLSDPDYHADSPDARSEICVPLRAEGETLGVLDIESTESAPLSENDLRLALAVADRLASALLLGRDQLALRDRARVFAALTEFGRTVNAIHDTGQLWPALVEAVRAVVSCDVVTLTTLDRTTGQYVVRAVVGGSPSMVGSIVQPGEGAAGRAMTSRTLIVIENLPRERYAAWARDRTPHDSLTVAAVPLIREGAVLGAIVVGRADLRAFGPLELEAIALLGAHGALAVANAHLLEEVSELAIHDGLTGLYNRRHFDAALDHMLARWRRHPVGRSLAAIMFDLDHFGAFNRQHGHQAGDEVLRVFAGVLRERVRSSDLVARYGGEEFVVVLEDCGLEDAVAVAESVRSALEGRDVAAPGGALLHATVSAGCAALDRAAPTKEALLRSADVALFMAKRAGRNQVVAV